MFVLVGRSLTKATIENANKKYEFNVNSSSCPYDVCKSRYLSLLVGKASAFRAEFKPISETELSKGKLIDEL
jgi:hypothetical protein